MCVTCNGALRGLRTRGAETTKLTAAQRPVCVASNRAFALHYSLPRPRLACQLGTYWYREPRRCSTPCRIEGGRARPQRGARAMLLRPMHLRSTPAFCQSKCRRACVSWHILLLLQISSRSSRTIKTRHLHHLHGDQSQAQLFQISCGKVEL